MHQSQVNTQHDTSNALPESIFTSRTIKFLQECKPQNQLSSNTTTAITHHTATGGALLGTSSPRHRGDREVAPLQESFQTVKKGHHRASEAETSAEGMLGPIQGLEKPSGSQGPMTTDGSWYQKNISSWSNGAFYPEKKYNRKSGLFLVLCCDKITSLLFRGADKGQPADTSEQYTYTHRPAGNTAIPNTHTGPCNLGLRLHSGNTHSSTPKWQAEKNLQQWSRCTGQAELVVGAEAGSRVSRAQEAKASGGGGAFGVKVQGGDVEGS